MAAMTEEMRRIERALDEGREYERRERERRIGAYYWSLGAIMLAFGIYQIPAVVPELWNALRSTPFWGFYAFTGPVLVLAGAVILRWRYFRRLKVDVTQLWGMPRSWLVAILVGYVGALGMAALAGGRYVFLLIPLTVAAFAITFALQGARGKERSQLVLAAVLGALATTFSVVPVGAWGILVSILAVGASLVVLGVVRMRRAMVGSAPA